MCTINESREKEWKAPKGGKKSKLSKHVWDVKLENRFNFLQVSDSVLEVSNKLKF